MATDYSQQMFGTINGAVKINDRAGQRNKANNSGGGVAEAEEGWGSGTGQGQGQLARIGLKWPAPGPVASFNYFFNSAISFQRNGYFLQNFGPPSNMTGLKQNGSFGPTRSPFHQLVTPRSPASIATDGILGMYPHPPLGFQQLTQPHGPSLGNSGVMYRRSPAMMVASNYHRNYAGKGPCQYPKNGQQVVMRDGDAGGDKLQVLGVPGWNSGVEDVRGHIPNYSEAGFFLNQGVGTMGRNAAANINHRGAGSVVGESHTRGNSRERFSRKVFVGGLPPDIDEEEIMSSFRRFGPLIVDWPHKTEINSYFPPKGYVFLLFYKEISVQRLIDACIQDDDKLYFCVSSPTIKDKRVQIRPWRLSDARFRVGAGMSRNPSTTVFVGGVPRPLKAMELAVIMDGLFGGVCHAAIDTDPELKYPKGAGRVVFSNQQSYMAAINARFVQLENGFNKRVSVFRWR